MHTLLTSPPVCLSPPCSSAHSTLSTTSFSVSATLPYSLSGAGPPPVTLLMPPRRRPSTRRCHSASTERLLNGSERDREREGERERGRMTGEERRGPPTDSAGHGLVGVRVGLPAPPQACGGGGGGGGWVGSARCGSGAGSVGRPGSGEPWLQSASTNPDKAPTTDPSEGLGTAEVEDNDVTLTPASPATNTERDPASPPNIPTDYDPWLLYQIDAPDTSDSDSQASSTSRRLTRSVAARNKH